MLMVWVGLWCLKGSVAIGQSSVRCKSWSERLERWLFLCALAWCKSSHSLSSSHFISELLALMSMLQAIRRGVVGRWSVSPVSTSRLGRP